MKRTITAIHYQIHDKSGAVRKVHTDRNPKDIDNFFYATSITPYDVINASLPWYLPEIGITVIGYEFKDD